MGRILALCALSATFFFFPVNARAANDCGNGVLEGGEECDSAEPLYIDGDPANGSCTTGNRCFYKFTCCKFNCQFVGQGNVCQDNDPCTEPDICNQVGVCLGGPDAPEGTPCDDGDFCTGTETCLAGECQATGDPCSNTACNHCNEDADNCFDPAATACSDGSDCVTGGTCDGAGTCVGGVFNNGPCDDGVFCNGTDTCLDGGCAVHTGDPCTGADGDGDCNESCDEAGDVCTAADPDGSTCSDGAYCNGEDDECSAGVCTGTGIVPCDDGNPCTIEACNELLDACANVGPSPDGTLCDDASPCTVDDECTGGFCDGTPTGLPDLCPWAVVHREQDKDMISTKSQVAVIGDMCGGILKLSGRPTISSDLVADEASGTPLQLSPGMVVGEDIASSGGGAKANPKLGYLPYTDSLLRTLAPGSNTPKTDASGSYDLSGANPLATDCHAARTSYPAITAMLDALPATQPAIESIRLKPGEATTITAQNAGGVNVIDVNRSVVVGIGSSLQISGGGSADTVVVLRVASKLALLVLGGIELTDGLAPEHTVIYVRGKKCLLKTYSVGSGTLLCSPAKLTSKGGSWIGSIYADGRKLNLRSKSTVFWLPFLGEL